MTKPAKPEPAFLCLHQMDEEDLAHYYSRLKHVQRIIAEAPDALEAKDGTVSFRQPLEGDAFHEVHVNIVPLPGSGQPGVRVWTDFRDGKSNFVICEPLRVDRQLDLNSDDDIFDLVELWLAECSRAFTPQGRTGEWSIEKVEKQVDDALGMINALVHVYLELGEDEQFIADISISKPYGLGRFVVVVGEDRLEFLSPATRAFISDLMPPVIKLETSRTNGVTHYRMGEMDSQRLTITAADLPEEKELLQTIARLKQIPAPHFLDDYVPEGTA